MLDRKLRSRIYINRQPTLWRHGIPFVDIIPLDDSNDETIHTSPLFLEPLNMDYQS